MSRTGQLPAAPLPQNPHSALLEGNVVYMYAFDIAYEMSRKPIRELLGQPVAQFAVDASKRSPRQDFFYRPQMVRMPPLERIGPLGPVRIERTIKLLPVGAISITVRVPFRTNHLEDLIAFHDLRFADGSWLYDEVRALAEEVRKALAEYVVRPVAALGDEEAYTVFCVHSPLVTPDGQSINGEDWTAANRREIAALLTEERDPNFLSNAEAEESTGRAYSYYKNDAVIIDWDAALIVDEPRYFEEILYIMELANLQLAELEAYDHMLDKAVETSYRDIRRRRVRGLTTATQRELRELRIDLARLQDELSNTTKFFGDWHLARIYQGLSARFHLGDWHKTIDEKLRTLDEMYQILRADQMNWWMLTLEITIVVLFVVEVLKSFSKG